MFGIRWGRTKELQEKIKKAESELGLCHEKMKQAASSAQRMLPCFESQIAAQSGMDQDFAKIIGYTQKTVQANLDNGQALEQLAIEFTNIRAMLQEDEAGQSQIQESMHRQAGLAGAAAEKYKECANFAGQMKKAQEGLAEDMGHMQSLLRQMADFSKDMGVLALNCAIEAGRLGETGRHFIAAAEGIRQMSCAYEQAAQSVADRMAVSENRLLEMEKQANGLTKGISEGQAGISHFLKGILNYEELRSRTAGRTVPKKMDVLTDCIKKMSQNRKEISGLQQQTLGEMEHIGKIFIKEQEARRELEEIASEIASCARIDPYIDEMQE